MKEADPILGPASFFDDCPRRGLQPSPLPEQVIICRSVVQPDLQSGCLGPADCKSAATFIMAGRGDFAEIISGKLHNYD